MSTSASCRLLALDTATERVHLALLSGGQVHERELAGGAQASTALLPALQALLEDHGLRWADLDALAFGRGPGAFTGLRTACAVTQGLALGLGKPVLVLDTLMAVAEAARQDSPDIARWVAKEGAGPLWALQDARMREVYAAAYRWAGSQEGWREVSAPQLWTLEHLAHQVGTGGVQCVAGNALEAHPSCFAALRGPRHAAAPRGRALASLAQSAWLRGLGVDAALALPLYVRDKVAQTTQERMAVRAGPLPDSSPVGAAP